MEQENQFQQSKKQKSNIFKSELWDLIKGLIVYIGIYFVITTYIAQPFLVKGRSMEQTFSDGDYLIVDQLTYNFADPKRSEVIVFHTEFIPGGSEREYYIKRVIGIPGDRIVIKDGGVLLYENNKDTPNILDEDYIIEGLKTLSQDKVDIILKENQYFVLGDNRGNSSDSRYWGPVEKKYIIGKPFIRLFPFNAITLFNNNSNNE
jgi:signal peptidase I